MARLVLGAVGAVASAVAGFIDDVLTGFGEWYEAMLEAGVDLIAGLLTGIADTAGDVADWISGFAKELGAAVSGWYDDAKGWGANLIAGLVAGVTGAAAAAYDAVAGVVGGVIDTAKDLLGIHSPSTVFAGIGENTADGYREGVEAGTPAAQGSVAALTSPADAQTATSAKGGAGRGAVDLGGAVFNFYGVPGAEAARDMFAEALTAILEGDADRLAGAAV